MLSDLNRIKQILTFYSNPYLVNPVNLDKLRFFKWSLNFFHSSVYIYSFFFLILIIIVTAKGLLRTVSITKTTIKTHSIKSSRLICLKNHIKPSLYFPPVLSHLRCISVLWHLSATLHLWRQLLISTSLTPLTDFLLSHVDKRMILFF